MPPDDFYNLSLVHLPPWMIGIIFAFIKQRFEINLSEKQIRINWITSWLLIGAVKAFHGIFGNFYFVNSIYDSVKRTVWGLHIGWLIFVFHHFNFDSTYKRFLSHIFWQPLSRLALAIYLTHHIYINITVANIQQTANFGFFWSIHILFGDLVAVVIIGALMFLFVEAPISKLTKF